MAKRSDVINSNDQLSSWPYESTALLRRRFGICQKINFKEGG